MKKVQKLELTGNNLTMFNIYLAYIGNLKIRIPSSNKAFHKKYLPQTCAIEQQVLPSIT